MSLKLILAIASLLCASESQVLKTKFDKAPAPNGHQTPPAATALKMRTSGNTVEVANPKQTMPVVAPPIDIVAEPKAAKKEFDPHKALKTYPGIGAKIGGLAGLILGALVFKSIAGALLGVAILGTLGLIAGGLMALRGTLLKMFPPPEPEEGQKKQEEQKKQ